MMTIYFANKRKLLASKSSLGLEVTIYYIYCSFSLFFLEEIFMKTIEALLHDHLKYCLPRQTHKKEKIKMRQREEEKINCNKDSKITLTFI